MCVRVSEQAAREILDRESAQKAIKDRQFQARIEADLERTRHSVFTALANGSTPPRTPPASQESLVAQDSPRTKTPQSAGGLHASEAPLITSQVFLPSDYNERLMPQTMP